MEARYDYKSDCIQDEIIWFYLWNEIWLVHLILTNLATFFILYKPRRR